MYVYNKKRASGIKRKQFEENKDTTKFNVGAKAYVER